MAAAGAVAAAIVAGTCTTAAAADASTTSAGGQARTRFQAYGDIFYIDDLVADGHSAVGTYQWGATQYFYWNSNGKGTTRKVDVDLTENLLFSFGSMVGDWEGTPTGGLLWNTLSTTTTYTS
ncbi:hypothetical protein [Streptomyces sp. NPDC057375]|uniref:hypothetical protein n=1 Tax=unclassified Streptomyces TaxID=2593676 RepID=UPI003640664F